MTPPKNANLPPKVTPLNADEIISRLMECESQRNNNIKVLDVNKRYSYGALQFQRETLLYFSRRYGLRTELMEEDLYNASLQREIAKKMILEDKNNLRNWLICARRLGLL